MTLESLSRAFLGRLTYDADHNTDWDKLTALALGAVQSDRRTAREAHLNALGADLIAFKIRHAVERHPRAIMGLAEVLRWRAQAISERKRTKIASLSIEEWCIDMCPTCLGAKIVTDVNGVQRACVLCAETGKRRYSDQERTEILGEPAHKLSKEIAIAHSGISLAVHVAAENAKRMLKVW